ncbi:hypothetical protein C8Q72DRAFT_179918 [Fomitopsis betulina]|nr:hypothetical protein C8Q72DRAFT_179918 [Fomitopsis betulina]
MQFKRSGRAVASHRSSVRHITAQISASTTAALIHFKPPFASTTPRLLAPAPGWDDHDDAMADAEHDFVDAQTSAAAANVSPTPPGLPSQIGASTAPARASYSSTPAASAHALHAGMYPLSPVSPVLPMSRASRARTSTARPAMDPVAEHAHGSSGGDVPHLRQLPSPPSSPDQREPNSRPSASRRRPSVTASQPPPSALPYRPRSSTTTSLPLSAAFQTSLLSGTPSNRASMVPPTHHRYPSLAVPTPRSRATSVSLEPIPDHSPLERPSDASRRMSTAELRHRHPPSTAATRPITSSGPGSAASGAERIPEYGEPGPSSYAYRHRSMQLERSPPLFTNPSSPSAPSARPFRPLPIPGVQSPSRPSPGDPRPVLVKKRDSPALRPLPASPFAPPPIASPPGPKQPTTRMRSSSVMSERSLPRQLPPLAPLPPLDFTPDASDTYSIRSRGK